MIFANASLARFRVLTLTTIVAAATSPSRTAQKQLPPRTDPPLILTATIGMPNVEGRIDHFAIDPGGQGFVSVFQQNDADHYDLLAEIPSS